LEPTIFKLLAASALGLLAVGTVAYRLLEGWSWVDSLYFSTVAVTTVGFGDIAPSTDGSKLFTVLYILSGISIITTYLNARMQRRAERHT
jgi:voltage-gated potassium channel Kch